MLRFFIERGLVIQREGRALEFFRRAETNLQFEDIETREVLSLSEQDFFRELAVKQLSILDAKSTSTAIALPAAQQDSAPLRKLSKKHEEDHERKLRYVYGMQKRGITKGQIELIQEAISEIASEPESEDPRPPSAQTVARWMRTLDRTNGDPSALITKYADHAPRKRQDPDHENLIQQIIEDQLDRSPVSKIAGNLYPKALKLLNERRCAEGKEIFAPVAPRTFSRRVEHMDAFDVLVLKHGREEAARRMRMIRGHLPAERPLEYVEIDHANLRFWVIDDLLMLPLGRPWITALRDRYSGMLLGIYVSFRGPSLYSTFRAIRHSLESHADLNQIWPDLENRWIAFGPGDVYVSDRGSDFMSHDYRYAIHQLGSEYSYCEVRHPWHKPYIERTFLTLHSDLLEAQPGEVYKGLSYSRDYNPKKDAVVRFSTLVYVIVKWAVDYHPFHRVGARSGRPIDLWMDGIADAPLPAIPNRDVLYPLFGKRHTHRLGHEGIRHDNLNYANDALHDLYKSIGKKPVTFIPHEENVGRIHVDDARERRWFEVGCTRPEYAEGLSVYQHQYIKRQTRIAGESTRDVEALMRVREEIELRFADDVARKSSSLKEKIARYWGVDSTSVIAGQPKSLAALTPPRAENSADTAQPTETTKIVIPDAPFVDAPTVDWRIV